MLQELVVKYSINNQITIGLQNVFRKQPDIFSCEIKNYNKFEIARREYYDKKHNQNAIATETFGDRLNRLYPALDIRKKSQGDKKANILRRGFAKLSADGKAINPHIPPFGVKQGQKIRESGAAIDLLMEKQGGAARVITLTLVGDTKEAFECLAVNSAYIRNRLFQVLRDNFKDCKNYFFVWEYQKRGALHLHICLWHKTPNLAAKAGAQIVQKWYEVLQDIQDKTGVDMFVRRDKKTYTHKKKWQSRNEPMRKSAGGYFSKYASKASNKKERQHIYHLAKKYPPSRFWGSSQSVKNIVKAEAFEFRFESHKSECSEKYYDGIRAIVAEFEIKAYNSYEWKFQKELRSYNGIGVEFRTITEGFKQNYYFSCEVFVEVKQAIDVYIGRYEY